MLLEIKLDGMKPDLSKSASHVLSVCCKMADSCSKDPRIITMLTGRPVQCDQTDMVGSS